MKNVVFFYLFLFSFSCFSQNEGNLKTSNHSANVHQTDDNWKPLFNGKDLNNWISFLGRRDAALTPNLETVPVFQVEDGMIHLYKDHPEDAIVAEGFLVSKKEYSNYSLKLEYKWGSKKFAQRVDKKKNSGLMFHAQDTGGFWPTSVECQIMEGEVGDIYTQTNAWITTTVDTFILDPVKNIKFPRYSPNGKLYDYGGDKSRRLIHEMRMDNSEGWNTIEIVVKDNEATYIVNGKVNNHLWNIRYIDPNNSSNTKPLLKGRIVLQAEGTEIMFRNIYIKEE